MSTAETATPIPPRRRVRPLKSLERWAGYALLRGLQGLVCLLPARSTSTLGRSIGRLLYRVAKRDRTTALRNLAMVYPEMTAAAREAMTQRVFVNFAKSALEFLRIPVMRPGEAAHCIRLEGLEYLDAALARGMGVMLLSGHMGNWEYIGIPLKQRGYTIDGISRDPELPATAELMRRIRLDRCACNMYPKQNTLSVMRALKQNRVVFIVADQHDWKGTLINFLGHAARGSLGPATFARTMGSAIVPVRATRDADDVIVVHFEPALDLQPSNDKAADIEAWTHQVHAAIEAFVRAEPEQWQWFHDRWRPDSYTK